MQFAEKDSIFKKIIKWIDKGSAKMNENTYSLIQLKMNQCILPSIVQIILQ